MIVENIIRIGSIFSIVKPDDNKKGSPIFVDKDSILKVKGTPQHKK